MKSLSKILIALSILLSFYTCNAQIKNAKTEIVKIYGNCGICEEVIEKTGNIKKVVVVDWNKDTKMATLTYDATKTNPSEILKRIALAGYDSDSFLAPDEVYAKLPDCCHYTRVAKTETKMEEEEMLIDTMTISVNTATEAQTSKPLTAVLDNYFEVKDGLVQTSGATASEKSKALLSEIKAVKMDQLAMDVHVVWMKVLKDLQEDAQQIADTKDTKIQRKYFMSLSKNMYALMSVAKYEAPIYYQFCPMANGGKGANWLSKENTIKNPYYGSQMLSCGNTVETIK